MSISDSMALRSAGGISATERRAAGHARPPGRLGRIRELPRQDRQGLDQQIDAACARIAPLWPLKHFVAVNPFFGLRDLSFQDASDTLARILGHGIYMARDYYREQFASGRITRDHLQAAIALCASDLSLDEIEAQLQQRAPRAAMGMVPVSRILEEVEGGLWRSFVTERISLHCAAYFDLGQAMVAMPWRDRGLYAAWRESAAIDLSPAMMGIGDFRHAVRDTPTDPRVAIAWAVDHLDIPPQAIERYLHASLLSIGGWAAWARYLRWQAELNGERDDAIVDLLAIRVTWDVFLYREKHSPALAAKWREMLEASMRAPSAKRQAAAEVDRVLLNAMEIGLQQEVIAALRPTTAPRGEATPRPALQAAFCIDVRSEVYRRSLETLSPQVQTLGFAGFFGLFIEVVPFAGERACSHVPVLFKPAHRVHECLSGDAGDQAGVRVLRRNRLALSKAWKGFKFSAASAFSFVEAAGLMYAPKLLTDSLGWSRPVPDPRTQGLAAAHAARLAPQLGTPEPGCAQGPAGIPEAEQLEHAERILKAMGLTGHFARLVLLAGHGSSSVNNPHATALDCGACAGQTGEASARVVAALLNRPQVRDGLRQRGIEIPADTWFLAGLHDTTTDSVTLFDTEAVPGELAADLAQLRQWLGQASELTRLQRAGLLGLPADGGAVPDTEIFRRARDWSQLRPEWALANNAAFIAAPRERSRGADLSGRAFLHDYDWRDDEGFQVLTLIMSAPMVVANWINLQYYGSVVDNATFGSGNKVLHNVVGGAIGVLEGNGGDLRIGLPLQSLHNGERWMHEPIRLSVFIEAPTAAMDAIIARQETVRQLVDNGWLHLFGIADDGRVSRRHGAGDWRPESR